MEAIIFIGIQASGKTTFYKQQFFETHIRLSLDMLKTRSRERQLVAACIRAKQSFVVDNTNVIRSKRAEYIQRAREGGFQVHGYFFEPHVDQAIAWNQHRVDKAAIPIKGLLGTLKRLERPCPEEGFDRLYRVNVEGRETFSVALWDAPE